MSKSAARTTWPRSSPTDRAALREQLEAATGERIAALEAVEPEWANGREVVPDGGRNTGDGIEPAAWSVDTDVQKTHAPKTPERDLGPVTVQTERRASVVAPGAG